MGLLVVQSTRQVREKPGLGPPTSVRGVLHVLPLDTCGTTTDDLCHRVLRVTGWRWLAESSDLLRSGFHIVLILILAVLIRWLARRAVRRLVKSTAEGRAGRSLARLPVVDAGPEATLRRSSRATTVGQLLRNVGDVGIGAVAAVLILGELGLDLAPIIASAGIAGVALGFGAQSLVKDVLAGLFLVMEDQYGVGDSVLLQERRGVVEAVGLRVTRIVDDEGTVWHVRNGEVLVVGNFSQGHLGGHR
jgi:small-conductance mechanosensitive channel